MMKSVMENLSFKGTRILVNDVIELLATSILIKENIEDYYLILSEEMIKEVLEWVAKIIRGEHYVRCSEVIT